MSRLWLSLSLTALIALGSAAPASAWPYHRTSGAECVSGGVMRTFPPRRMAPTQPTDFRRPEQVYWQPYLQRWRNGRWRTIRRGPQFWAFTSSYGFYQGQGQQAWHQSSNPGSQVLFYPFTGLRAGNYRIKHWLWWSWGRRAWHGHSHGRCRFV